MPYNTFFCTKCTTVGIDKWNEQQYYITEYCFQCKEDTLHSKEIPNRILKVSDSSQRIKK